MTQATLAASALCGPSVRGAVSRAEHGYKILNVITSGPSCTDHQQDAWLTAAHLTVALEQIRKQLPYVRDLHLQSDNASNYHSSQVLDQFQGLARECGYRLLSMWHNEPGEGKDLTAKRMRPQAPSRPTGMSASGARASPTRPTAWLWPSLRARALPRTARGSRTACTACWTLSRPARPTTALPQRRYASRRLRVSYACPPSVLQYSSPPFRRPAHTSTYRNARCRSSALSTSLLARLRPAVAASPGGGLGRRHHGSHVGHQAERVCHAFRRHH